VLTEIRIRDLGVIDEAVIELGPGLTVLTGETGAGKTMVVTGLGLLLGARGDSALVRTGADRTVVEGLVDLPADHSALTRAADAGAEVSDGLVLVRTVTAEGRSRAHVGGRSAPVGLLAELAEHLVAVHGQADQWRLRRPEEHRELLDAFGGPTLGARLTAYRRVHRAHAEASTELERLRGLAAERAREVELLELGLARVAAVDPQPGEDVALRTEDERLSHAEELRAAAGLARAVLAGDDEGYAVDAEGVLGPLGRARAALAAVAAADPALGDLEQRLGDLTHLAADLASDLTGYVADVDLDPARLRWVQERRAELAALTRTLGSTVEEVLAWRAGAEARLTELVGVDDRIAVLEGDTARLAEEREAAARELTTERERAAERLAASVTAELRHLAMGTAVVTVSVSPSGRFGPDGADEVEVGLAANPGTPPRSVTRAASGGELSRVMLALELAAGSAGAAAVPTFVFDEVDAGVGGRAALDVGARLAALAEHAQVVVVTHLAQVAAHADRHLVVAKSDDGQVTRSGVALVTGPDRVAELARMMAGADTPAARRHAEDLLARAGRRGRERSPDVAR
jgi:DNA repair protein RecN (Recombination protein N)